jgi:hypothetical protein
VPVTGALTPPPGDFQSNTNPGVAEGRSTQRTVIKCPIPALSFNSADFHRVMVASRTEDSTSSANVPRELG